MNRKAGAACADEAGIVRAALAHVANAGDTLAPEPPEFPTVAVRDAAGPPHLTRLTRDSEVWRSGWDGSAPDPKLVARWFDQPYAAYDPCGAAGTATRTFGALPGGWPAASAESRRDGAGPVTIRATRPVRDAAGSHALMLYSLAGTGLGGRVELVLLERGPAGWRKIGSHILSVS